jgi:hypothetical protein
VLEAVFILLEFPSPSRRIFIGSHSLPPSLVRRIGPSWGKAFGEEFAGMYRKKRNKRSNAHDMMDITFKSVVHALRLSGIDIPKMHFFLPNY